MEEIEEIINKEGIKEDNENRHRIRSKKWTGSDFRIIINSNSGFPDPTT